MFTKSNCYSIRALLIALVTVGASSQVMATPQGTHSSGSYTVLAGTAVTCTDTSVTGDVGVSPGTAITQTNCSIDGTAHAADTSASRASSDFLTEYQRLAGLACDRTLSGDLAGVTLTQPGVYCVDAASTTTNGTLRLVGSANATWIFKIGNRGTGGLTGTGFSVVLEGGGTPCNVTWWVAQAATLTDSAFQGSIYAGAAITITGGTFNGDAFAKAAVTLTGATVTGCDRSGGSKGKCNQGVGNGSEGCDPGNSNQGDPNRSNDERGGTPGDPGRRGGNGK